MQNNPPGPNDPTYIPQPPPPPPQYTQYPQTPYPPPPMMQPPPKKRRTWLWIIVGIVALIIFYQIGQAAFSQTNTSTPPAGTSAPSGNTPAATQYQSLPSPTPTQPQASPTHATRISATHGRPRVGGPISDFYGKYGTPHNQNIGGGPTWNISSSPDFQNISADADANGIVTKVTFVGSVSWSQAQTESYCNRFLPTDASEFNRATGNPTYIDYHSSIGEVVMQVADQGSCVVFIVQP